MICQSLDTLTFDNRFTRELPADPVAENYRRQVPGACFSRVDPVQVSKPQLVAYAREVSAELGIEEETCQSDDFAQVFAGNRILDRMEPYATCYGGHQFGSWAGQLGDGRAINLGETINHENRRWALQLKGAGPTPYSRTADGLAVLRSSVREFLCSEAMYHLGVPTTRALCLVTTGDEVVRDMFYDGNPKSEPGAIVCRVSPSFTRFGSFEIFTARRELEVLKQLLDYTVCVDFPHLGKPSVETYVELFDEVCRTTAEMIVHWMRVGFVHGVMNTDNMSILGLTIDYGPYGWLEDYDQDWTPNTTDAGGRRYRFGHQSQIALWNLFQLANALAPLMEEVEPLQSALDRFPEQYNKAWNEMMGRKLGLDTFDAETDAPLVAELLEVLQLAESDMTIFFRKLADLLVHPDPPPETAAADLMAPLMDAYYTPDALVDDKRARIANWIRRYQERLRQDGVPDAVRRERMNAVNPKYVLRNYLAQLAIDKAEEGDNSMVVELLELLRRPYDEQSSKEEFAVKRPDWARHRAGCSMLSCSS